MLPGVVVGLGVGMGLTSVAPGWTIVAGTTWVGAPLAGVWTDAGLGWVGIG